MFCDNVGVSRLSIRRTPPPPPPPLNEHRLKVYTDQLRCSAPKEWLSVWLLALGIVRCVETSTALEVGVTMRAALERKKEIAS